MDIDKTFSLSFPSCVLASGSIHLGLLAFLSLGLATKSTPILDRTEISFIEVGAPVKMRTPTAPRVVRPPAAVVVKSSPSTEIQPRPAEAEEAPTADQSIQAEVGSTEFQVGVSSYEAEVATMLNSRKRYPEAARRLRQQGRVKMTFEVDRSGTVLSVTLVEPSTHTLLNEAAQKLVNEIKSFKAFPDNIKAQVWKFTVPIEYKM